MTDIIDDPVKKMKNTHRDLGKNGDNKRSRRRKTKSETLNKAKAKIKNALY